MPRLDRWWIIGLVAVVAACMVAGSVIVYLGARTPNTSAPAFHRGDWQPPQQTVIASSMRERPVPGWQTGVGELGLPESSIFGTSDDRPYSQPFVGFVDNNGYFLASSPGTPDRQWWLAGLDVHTGRQLFSPVSIDAGSRFPKCFVNGPKLVLCLADAVHGDRTETTAWVIDAPTGEVVFNGPTELHTTPGSGVRVIQVGIYAVAHLDGQGIYGIGPSAETTWSVPNRSVASTDWAGDFAPPTLAAVSDTAKGVDRMDVISVVDGRVIKPSLDEGLRQLTAVAYPGGFALEAVADPNPRIQTPDRVVFFDDSGNHLRETEVSGFLRVLSTALPVVEDLPVSTVFGANGAGLIQVPDQALTQNAVLIGHRLYAPESSWEGPVKLRRWHQFDLTTGAEGTTCRANMSHYLANDGSVGIFETFRHEVTGATTFAMDLTTCEKLWSTPINPDSFHRLWRIGDTLVELSDDGKELYSLVAPG